MPVPMIERIISSQQRHPKAWLSAIIIMVIFSAYIASHLQIDPSFSALVGKDSEYNTQNRILQTAYGRNDAILVLVGEAKSTNLDNTVRVDSDQTTQYITTLKETLNQSQYAVNINGPIYDEQGRIAQLVINLQVPDTPRGFKTVLTELNTLSDQVGTPPGIETTITGLPVLLQRVTTLLITDNLITVLITLGLIIAVLLWYTKNLVYTLITVAIPATSLLTLAACMVLLGINVTITLAAVGVLALGLGADYSIHIATHYLKARRDGKKHLSALQHTIQELKVPILASFITTLAGFAALILGVSPSSQSQGIVLALAITIIFILTFILFPLLISIFGAKIQIKQNPTFAKIRHGMQRLAIYQANHSKTVLAIIAIITVIMIVGMTQVRFSTSNSNWIPDGDPIASSFREITYTFGDTESLRIVLNANQGDLRNVQTARDVAIITELIGGIPNIDSVTSPYDDIPFDSTHIQETLTHNRSARFNHDYTLTTIEISTQNLGQDEAGDSIILQEIRDILYQHPIHHANTAIHGDAVRFEELGDSLEQDAGKTTLIGLALVFLIASIIYASFTAGFLALLPIIIAIIWALGLMGYFDVPFTSLSTGIISLVLGIGVDFSIHLVDGIDKRVRKLGIENSIVETLEEAGSAIVLSSMTTFAGFMALTFATLLGTQRLGWSLAFSILAVFVVTISMVPAVMSIKYRRYKK